jgi:[protein-PII] uridylyltransferase
VDSISLSRSLLQETKDINDLPGLTRAYVHKARGALLEKHRAGAGGLEIVAVYSTIMDELICHLFSAIGKDFLWRYPTGNPQCAIIAQGGYGRSELNPHSDIDLLFIYSWKVSPFVEAVTEKLLYTLWDAGLQVGHAIRSIGESMRLASTDMKVRTSLLDTRYVCGDQSLYIEFEKAVESRLARKRVNGFVDEKLAENQARHAGYGGSVYLLEPDVKESEGGLRDIHTARWIARVKTQVKDLDGLASKGIVGAADIEKLKGSQDFLLRVRNELHFSAGKHQDQLTFEEQEKVSQALDFQGEGSLKAVEVFMSHYYRHASEISRLTALIIHRLTDCGRPLLGGIYGSGRNIREGVKISRDHITITKPEILRSDPGNLLRIFDEMQKHRCSLSHETRELLREHLDLIDDEFRASAAANVPFFQILKWKEGVYDTLLEMHRAGVLGAFIPEFGRLLCMVLHDAYHIYTVDQHSLRLVQEIERLKAGEFKESLPLLTQLAREAEKIELLYLGLMFHDIGKGFGGGHSERGAVMVRRIANRMRLNVDDGALVEFLVRHHLLMTHTAFRRDLEDEKTICDFAQTMGNVNNLKMLYLLTYADVRGVGPDVWNPWKASLLGELYVKTLTVLEDMEKGEFQRQDFRAALGRIQTRVRRELSAAHSPEEVDHFIEVMPERYFLSMAESEIPAHFALMQEFRNHGAAISVEHFPEKDCSTVAICTADRPGLFASIAGVMAAMRLDILNARIFTASDGRILDVFRVSHGGRSEITMSEQRWSRFRSTLEAVLDGNIDVERLVEKSQSTLLRKHVPKVSTSIHVDNEASAQYTVVEVFTADRLGILFKITYTLHQLGLSIHVAKISTNVDQVADVFFVTTGRGDKVEDSARIEAIRQTLYASLVPDDERIAAPHH